ncbi:MAG: hypothetical protein JHD16_04050 [Solirubrobacteraceae bacterium]|nr:hypothetical protein [Solirubrobacteraceae bacterium]
MTSPNRMTPGSGLPADAAEAIDVLDAVLAESGISARQLAADHRGLSVEVSGWPLDIGVSVQDGFLRAQAQACGHGQVDPHDLLHDHRKRAFAKFTHADGGAVWVEADLPLVAATAELVDAMLGALIEAAGLARERAKRTSG